MEKKKQFTLTPRVDYVTVLIILFFALLTMGVFIWFRHRLIAIDSEIKQSSFVPVTMQQEAKATVVVLMPARSQQAQVGA